MLSQFVGQVARRAPRLSDPWRAPRRGGHRAPPRPWLRFLGLALAVLAGLPGGGRSAPQEKLTAAQRAELEKRSTALNNRAIDLLDQGKPADAADLLRQALRIDQQLYPKADHPNGHALLAQTLFNLGYALDDLEDWPGARQAYQEALDMRRALSAGKDDADVALTLNNLARVLRIQAEYARARDYFQQAVDMRRRLYPDPNGHPDLASSLTGLGTVLTDQGKYAEARRYSGEAADMYRRLSHGKDSEGWAISLNNLAYVFSAEKSYVRSRELYEQAEKMFRRVYQGKDHPNLARGLHSLGAVCQEQQNFVSARDYYEQALAMYRRLAQGKDSAAVAEVLNQLGRVFQAMGDYVKAQDNLGEALAIRRRLYGDRDHPNVALSLNNLGALLEAKGDPTGARDYFQKALDMRRRLYPVSKYPRGHELIASTLNNLGAALQDLDEYSGSRDRYEEARAMYLRLFPPGEYPQGHPWLAETLNNLGTLRDAQGDFRAARRYYEDALAMRRGLYPDNVYPEGHPDVARSLDILGSLLELDGRYAQSRAYLERALEMRRQLYPESRYPAGHPDIAFSLNDLAILYEAEGEYAQALKRFEAALAMRDKLYPPGDYPRGHPSLVTSQSNLGYLYQAYGRYGEAQACYEKSWKLCERLYPTAEYPRGNDTLASVLSNLASVLQARGDYPAAEARFQDALTMRRKLFPADTYPSGHPALATTLLNLAALRRDQGNYAGARKYAEQAVAMRRRLYPKDAYPLGHPDLALARHNLGLVLLAEGARDGAFRELRRALDMFQDLADDYTASASEAEALNFAARLPRTRDALLSATRRLVGGEETVYGAVWRTKAAVLRALEGRQRLLWTSTDSGVEDLLKELAGKRRELSRLLLAPPAAGRDTGPRVKQTVQEKEELERKLAERVLEERLREQLKRSAPADLLRLLPVRTVFVDLIRYVRSEQDAGKPGRAGMRHVPAYAAFVLCHGRGVVRVELGADGADASPAEAIDEAVAAWIEAIDKGYDDGPRGPQAKTLQSLIWAKLAPHVPPDTETLLLAPDSSLARLPWAALPVAPGGPVLLEKYAVAVMPHGPFLLERLSAPAPPEGPADQLLAVGGVDYDKRPPQAAQGEGKLAPPWDGSGPRRIWEPLKTTEQAVKRLQAMIAPGKTIPLSGTDATTTRLLADLPRVRWAFLGTHGFASDAKLASALRLERQAFETELTGQRALPGARTPLVLSGLALAGANLPPSRDVDGVPIDDGLVTAEAIAGLPLGKLDLVVLSACRTALGEGSGEGLGSKGPGRPTDRPRGQGDTRGEGIFGLQRAFHMAGTRDVVAALWEIQENTTSALLALFHDLVWREHTPPLVAMRLAQLYLYHHPQVVSDLAELSGKDFDDVVRAAAAAARREAGPLPSGERSPTLWWAGFTVSGTGR